MGNANGSNDRLERIEGIIEALANRQIILEDAHIQFVTDHKQLLTAQVLLTDQMRDLAAAQKTTEENLNALIKVVDDLVRRTTPPRRR